MRVLVICSQFPPRPSPESNHALMLCEKLGQSGADVHLLTSPLLPAAPRPHGFTLHPEITSWSWSGAWQLIRAARRIRPDVVLLLYVGWIYGHHPMITFAPSFLRWSARRISVVTQFENTQGGPTLGTFRLLTQWRVAAALAGGGKFVPKFGSLLARSDAIIALSQSHAAEIASADSTARAKTVLIPAPPLLRMRTAENGRTRAEGRALLGLGNQPDTVVLTYFGYVYPGKGVETLLAAMARLQDQEPASSRPAYVLVLIGLIVPELQEGMRELVQGLRLKDRVVWLGHQDGEECSSFLWASDAAILPFDEGVRMNNSSLAVCATHGLPIITTEGETLEPAFRHNQNVILCPPRNVAALAAAIESLLVSPGLRRDLGRNALAMALQHFSWDVTMLATSQVLQSVHPRRHRASPPTPRRDLSGIGQENPQACPRSAQPPFPLA